jgi:hypothetical protein
MASDQSRLHSPTPQEGILSDRAQQVPRTMLLWNPTHSQRTRMCGAPGVSFSATYRGSTAALAMCESVLIPWETIGSNDNFP